MEIKINTEVADDFSSRLVQQASIGEQSVQYSSESRLEGVDNGKVTGAKAAQSFSSYQSILAEDAINIAKLNIVWRDFDQAIAKASKVD